MAISHSFSYGDLSHVQDGSIALRVVKTAVSTFDFKSTRRDIDF